MAMNERDEEESRSASSSADSDPPLDGAESGGPTSTQDPGGRETNTGAGAVGAAPSAKPVGALRFWLAPMFVVGLVLLYIGERIAGEGSTWRALLSGAGVALAVMSTALRFAPKNRIGVGVERVLPLLSVLGLFAIALYFATTDWGQNAFGFARMETAPRERALGVLTVLWVALLAISVVPMLFAEAALYPMRQAAHPEQRRVHAAAASGLTLVLAAIYGALFVFAADGLDFKVDYSYFKTSEPSESTRNIAKSLKDPVRVIGFFPQVSEVRGEVERYLRDLARGNPKLQVELKDRLLAPKQARDLNVNKDGVLVLARGTTTERLEIGSTLEEAGPKLKTLDRNFQERLIKMVRSRRVAYLTVGHGEINDGSRGANAERSGMGVRKLLEQQNYQVKELGLAQGLGSAVPDDAGIVLVLGPSDPFAPEEIAALERYATAGGHLLLALDPDAAPANPGTVQIDAPPAPAAANKAAVKPTVNKASATKPASPDAGVAVGDAGVAPAPEPEPPPPAPAGSSTRATLQALARIVGLEYSADILANDKQHLRRRYNDSDRTILVTNRFSSHASVSTLSRNSSRAATVLLGAGSIEPVKGGTAKVDVTLRSLPGTFADSNNNYQAEPTEKTNVFSLAAAVSRPLGAGDKKTEPDSKEKPADTGKKDGDKAKAEAKTSTGPEEMRAFVIADADVFTDVALNNAMFNQLLFADAVRWLGGEESFAGAVNSEEDVKIEHTKQKDLVWFYATIFGAPALVLGLGLAYSRHARRPRGGKR